MKKPGFGEVYADTYPPTRFLIRPLDGISDRTEGGNTMNPQYRAHATKKRP